MIGLLLFALWGAVWWRFRGGAFTTLTGWNPGTDGARSMCAFAFSVWLDLAFGVHWLVIGPMLFVGMLIGGWAPFQGMGLSTPGTTPEASWMRWLPLRLGLPVNTFWHDFAGMTESGVLCMAPAFVLAALMFLSIPWALGLAAVLFAPCYALARFTPWSIKNFASGQAWGEFYVGAVIATALWLTASGFVLHVR